jgi:hypothetical protein
MNRAQAAAFAMKPRDAFRRDRMNELLRRLRALLGKPSTSIRRFPSSPIVDQAQ